MIGTISGILEEINGNEILINCNGVGYEIFASQTTISNLGEIGTQAKVYTYLNINSRDNEVSLFGFASREEKRMFINLTSVSGVGPKTAITILSSVNLYDLASSIASGDPSLIAKVKGIGKKSAERIVLELREKIESSDFNVAVYDSNQNSDEQEYAINVLLSLGLNRFDATKKVREVFEQNDKAEDIVQKVLRKL